MRTSKKEILLFLFSSWIKLRTEFFWKMPCSMLISLILLARIRISSTYLRYIGGFFYAIKNSIFEVGHGTSVVHVRSSFRSILGLILRGGRDELLYILFMIISTVSLTGTLVNEFFTSSGANIPLLGLFVWRTWINSCIDVMLYLLGKYGEISCFIVFVSSYISVGICDIIGRRR